MVAVVVVAVAARHLGARARRAHEPLRLLVAHARRQVRQREVEPDAHAGAAADDRGLCLHRRLGAEHLLDADVCRELMRRRRRVEGVLQEQAQRELGGERLRRARDLVQLGGGGEVRGHVDPLGLGAHRVPHAVVAALAARVRVRRVAARRHAGVSLVPAVDLVGLAHRRLEAPAGARWRGRGVSESGAPKCAQVRRSAPKCAEVRRIAPNCAELRGAPDAVLEDGDPRAREAEKVLRRRRDVARRRAAAAAVARSAFVRVVLVSRRLLLRPRGATPVALRRVAVAVARRLLAALPGEPRAEHVARELLLRVRLRRAERPQLAAALGAGGVVLEVLLLLGDLGREGGGGERVEEVGGWRRGGGVWGVWGVWGPGIGSTGRSRAYAGAPRTPRTCRHC